MYREAQAKVSRPGRARPAAPSQERAGPKEGEVVDAEFEDLGEKK